MALVLGTFESLIPTVSEEWFGSVLAGKSMTMAFELAVVGGIVFKTRRPGVHLRVPAVLSAVIAASCFVEPWLFGGSAIWLMVIAGLPVGAGITMGNEYAAASVAGFEEVGMGLYSTLRITGSFLGPLFLNVAYPQVLLALSAVSLGCVGLVLPGRKTSNGSNS